MDPQPASPTPENQPTPPAQPTPPPAQPQPAAPATPAAAAPAPGSYISNPVDLFKPSMSALKTNLGDFIVAGILLGLLIAALIGGVIGSVAVHQALLSVLIGLVGLAVIVIYSPLVTLLYVAGAKGQKLSFGEALKKAPHFALRFLAVGFLTALAVLGGVILLVVPGLIFGTWFSLAAFVLVDQDCGAVEAMKRSKALIKGRFFEMWGMFGVSWALQILYIIPILGALVAFVISLLYSAAPAVRYVQLQELKQSNQPAPAVSGMNWVMIGLAIVGIVVSGVVSAHNRAAAPTSPYNFPATNSTTTGQ